MWFHQTLIKNRLYQVTQELSCCGKTDTLTEIIDIVMNLNNRTIELEREILN